MAEVRISDARPGWWFEGTLAVGLAAVLTICDALAHVGPGVLSYAEPQRFSVLPGQPTLQVFVGFLLFSLLLFAALRLWFSEYPAMGATRTAMLPALFVMCYFASGLLRDLPGLLFSGFLVLWALLLGWFDQRLRAVVGFCVGLAVVGPVVEGSYSASGFFAYSDASVFGAPVWLGGLYMVGGLAAIAVYSSLRSRLRRG